MGRRARPRPIDAAMVRRRTGNSRLEKRSGHSGIRRRLAEKVDCSFVDGSELKKVSYQSLAGKVWDENPDLQLGAN